MSKRTDISQQIRKYLDGELDARAMHQLEREALNDLFLAEALEGYEKVSNNQEQNLSDIHARLQERITEKRKRIVLWRTISIAASVLIVLSIGGLWLMGKKTEHKLIMASRIFPPPPDPLIHKQDTISANNIAQRDKKFVLPVKHKKSPVNKRYIAVNNGVEQADGGSPPPIVAETNANKSLAASDIQKDSVGANEVVVTGYGTKKRQDQANSDARISSAPISKDFNRAAATPSNNEKLYYGRTITGTITGKDDGLPIPGANVSVKGKNMSTITDNAGKFRLYVPEGSVLVFSSAGYSQIDIPVNNRSMLAVVMTTEPIALGEVAITSALGVKKQARSLGYSTATITSGSTVTGIVTAKDDGQPLPGVTIKIKGTNIGTQTTSEGKFTLNAVPDNAILQFNFIGYTSEEMVLNKKNIIAVAMSPSGNSLSEVVVTQPLDGNGEQEYQSARPVTGWSNYKQYLKDNATSPDGKTGVVKLSFIVNTDNSLSDFKIIKSVSAKTDSAAVELVKNGINWIRNTDNKPQKVRLRIKFTGR